MFIFSQESPSIETDAAQRVACGRGGQGPRNGSRGGGPRRSKAGRSAAAEPTAQRVLELGEHLQLS